ncbi:MAG: hypothetical protein JSR73_19020 [Proteobacteria bacterium]|nr:hypothetical protein [Pseudomonadota bacterium]
MLRSLLLSIHLLAVIVWLGFGCYEILVLREIGRARDRPEEAALIRLYGRYAGIVAVATLIVAAAGVAMTVAFGWGFFTVRWLALKQAIMAAIVLAMIALTPLFRRTYAAIAALRDGDAATLAAAREAIRRVERHVILMRVGGVLAVLLAVWRPT